MLCNMESAHPDVLKTDRLCMGPHSLGKCILPN
jgi:hypothetical protein